MSHISKLGYCRYQMTQVPENWETPVEILNGYAVQFEFDYTWNESNTECTLSNIKWAPGQVIYENGIRTFEKGTKIISEDENQTVSWDEENPLTFSTEGFRQSNLTITVNNQNVLNSGIIYQQQSLSESPEPFSITANFLTVNFSYIYLDEETNITYSVIIPDIKILKVSKYDKNVVFTYDGVNELLTKIKEYPVINIEEVDASQWISVSDGQPSIKITHGNPNFDGSNNNYKYVKVGSNIKFKDANGNNLSAISPSNTQETGTFRVSVNSDTFEVPIAGLAGGNGDLSINGSLVPAIDSQLSSSTAGYNLGSTTTQWNILYARGAVFGNDDEPDSQTGLDAAYEIKPYVDNTGSLGTLNNKWGKIYSNKYIVGSTTSTVPTDTGEIGEIVFVLRN